MQSLCGGRQERLRHRGKAEQMLEMHDERIAEHAADGGFPEFSEQIVLLIDALLGGAEQMNASPVNCPCRSHSLRAWV